MDDGNMVMECHWCAVRSRRCSDVGQIDVGDAAKLKERKRAVVTEKYERLGQVWVVDDDGGRTSTVAAALGDRIERFRAKPQKYRSVNHHPYKYLYVLPHLVHRDKKRNTQPFRHRKLRTGVFFARVQLCGT